MNVYIFTGPTLSPHDVCAELDAVCLPPVSQGDVYRAGLSGPLAIGIIDGYFESVPAVWHKEILWALTQGIHVFGSASMGALRAVELASFGMVGIGKIFEAFRDGTLEDDDGSVRGVHAPTSPRSRPTRKGPRSLLRQVGQLGAHRQLRRTPQHGPATVGALQSAYGHRDDHRIVAPEQDVDHDDLANGNPELRGRKIQIH